MEEKGSRANGENPSPLETELGRNYFPDRPWSNSSSSVPAGLKKLIDWERCFKYVKMIGQIKEQPFAPSAVFVHTIWL